jgi:hypothetical protein
VAAGMAIRLALLHMHVTFDDITIADASKFFTTSWLLPGGSW